MKPCFSRPFLHNLNAIFPSFWGFPSTKDPRNKEENDKGNYIWSHVYFFMVWPAFGDFEGE